MEDYLKELSEIPWINVVESCRAYEVYRRRCLMEGGVTNIRVVHRCFSFSFPRQVSVDRMYELREPIVCRYVLDTISGTLVSTEWPVQNLYYSWEKGEGEFPRIFTENEVDRMISKECVSAGALRQWYKGSGSDDAAWLLVRSPWEIDQNNEVSTMYGRFGCAVFHKDAERVKD